jgi:hypothetical protein
LRNRIKNVNMAVTICLPLMRKSLSVDPPGSIINTQESCKIFPRALTKGAHQQDADYKPDSVAKNHLSGTGVAAGIQQLTQGIGRESLKRPLFSFAPDGVCLSPGRRRP